MAERPGTTKMQEEYNNQYIRQKNSYLNPPGQQINNNHHQRTPDNKRNYSFPNQGPQHPPFNHQTRKDREETNDEWIEYRNIEVQGIQRRSAKTTKTGRRRKMVKTNNL